MLFGRVILGGPRTAQISTQILRAPSPQVVTGQSFLFYMVPSPPPHPVVLPSTMGTWTKREASAFPPPYMF